jgi:HK97 gp10 family phage protein
MGIEFTLDGRAFKQGLEAELQRIETATKKEEERLAHFVVDSAQPPVLTGELEGSKFVREGKDGTEFGWASDHAAFVEYGTENMEPQPFARPAELSTVHEVKSPI